MSADKYIDLREAVVQLYLQFRLGDVSACPWCGGEHGTALAIESATYYEHTEDCAWMRALEAADIDP
jgi:hypothetical protein